MDTVELNVVELEDGKEYLVFYILEYNKNNYVFLANENDPDDLVIRKIVVEGNERILEKIEEDEFEEVINEFNKKFSKNEKEGKNEK